MRALHLVACCLLGLGLPWQPAVALVARGLRVSRMRNLLLGAEPSPLPQSEQEVRAQLQKSREVSSAAQLSAGAAESQMTDASNDAADLALLQRLKSKRSYGSILVERFMQAVDDYQLSQRTKEYKELAASDPIYFRARQSVEGSSKREHIVVLGTGWGAHAFLKTVDASKYDITVISPRNYFLFTPMLAASAVGTVEFRSICEPIRNVNPLADYLEASAQRVDTVRRVVSCQSVKCTGTACEVSDFDVSYDHLLVAVGATSNTFGIKGVRENCIFLKQVEDAASLRKALASCFERANFPSLSEEEKRAALSFVVVGAGPTGVEFTSELRDWIEGEGRRYYPNLLNLVSLKLVEAGGAVLAVFDVALQAEALKLLTERESTLVRDGLIDREMTTVLLKAGVKEVGERFIELSSGEKIPYGFCVWAAGNGPIPFVLDMVDGIDEQRAVQPKARGRIAIDGWLRAAGAPNVFAIGDCTFQEDNPLPATAQVASQQGSYLGRLFTKGYDMSQPGPLPPSKADGADPQVAFLSETINVGNLGVRRGSGSGSSSSASISNSKRSEGDEFAKPFQFLNLGVLAYIGASKALAQVSIDEKQVLGSGPLGFLLWRGIYWFKQVSWRNRVLVGLDWVNARVFGRDIGSL